MHILFALIPGMQGCGPASQRPVVNREAVPAESAAVLRAAVGVRLDPDRRPEWVSMERWSRVIALYDRFERVPLWLAPGDVQRAAALLHALEEAPSHALRTTAYGADTLRRLMSNGSMGARPPTEKLADADVLLTAAYLAYATDMLAGQVDPRTVSQAWYIQRRPAEIDSALAAVLQTADTKAALAALVPQGSSYAILRAAYARYRAIADSGGWPVVPGGATLRPGSRDPERVPALRRRLDREGLRGPLSRVIPDSAVYDAELVMLVKRFQGQHGLDTTGALEPASLRSLNVTAAERAHQIGANMERLRWLPRALGSRYVIVNVPSFRLHAHDSAGTVLEMNVAVGAEYDGRSTPAFSDSMEYVVFRPYWNVPTRIAQQEVLPRARVSPGYFERFRYEWYMDDGVRRLRQRPGPTNALGSVKFMFPNQFAIYMHDTPDQGVFARSGRAVSFGCIRLEHPDLLAQFVLGWSLDSVRRAMRQGRDNSTVRLTRKLAVYIVYFTAFPRDGRIAFADDVYDRDAPLDRALIDSSMRRHP